MATHTITISASTAAPKPLSISETEGETTTETHTEEGDKNFTTDVQKDDVVEWVIAAGSNITAITAITKDAGTNVFSSLPAQNETGTTWSATVGSSPDPRSDVEEEYTISYTVAGVVDENGNPIVQSQDPKMRMKATGG